jgi:outer membrane receptor for ferrienterochelin and colicin
VVVEDNGGERVSGASVELIVDGRSRRAQASSDSGAFRFTVLPYESYQIRVVHPGYRQVTTPVMNMRTLGLRDAGTLSIEVRVSASTVALAPVTVLARSTGQPPMVQAFHRRRERRMGGYFITRDDLDRRGGIQLTDVLREVPGITLRTAGGSVFSLVVHFRGAGVADGDCPAQIYVDGVLANRRVLREPAAVDSSERRVGRVADDGWGIDNIVSPSSIEGIEIYKGIGGVPVEFMSRDAKCGVIAIWTRSGTLP